MASQTQPPFRYPTQTLADLELTEEVPLVRTGMTPGEVAAAFGSPHPRSANHLLVWQEPFAARDGTLKMRRVYRKLPGAALTGTAVRDSTWGAAATVTTREVAVGTAADAGLNVIESVVEPKDAQTARKRTTTLEWPTLTSRRINARGDLETVTETKAAPDSALPAATLNTTETRLQAETQNRGRLIVGEVAEHAELVDRKRGDVTLIPPRLRALETYRVTESLVTPDTEPDAIAANVVESKVTGKTRVQSIRQTTARDHSPGDPLPSVTDRKLGPDGELLEITEALVDPATVPAGAFEITGDMVRETGGGVAIRTTTQLAGGESYPALTAKIVDAETRTPISIVRQIVPAGSPLAADSPLIIDQKIDALDKWRSLHVVTSLDALPSGYQERKHLSFRFPGLFYDYDSSAGGTVMYRSPVSRVVMALAEVSFGYSEAEPALLELTPVSWSYPLGFTGNSLLTNGEHFEYTAQSVPLSLDVPQSTPSRTQYEALIGTYAAVSGSCERWKGGVWRTEVWKVVLC